MELLAFVPKIFESTDNHILKAMDHLKKLKNACQTKTQLHQYLKSFKFLCLEEQVRKQLNFEIVPGYPGIGRTGTGRPGTGSGGPGTGTGGPGTNS